jgi:hypothetical protein
MFEIHKNFSTSGNELCDSKKKSVRLSNIIIIINGHFPHVWDLEQFLINLIFDMEKNLINFVI